EPANGRSARPKPGFLWCQDRHSNGRARSSARPAERLARRLSVRQTVRHNHVVCLDCGFRSKTLRRHINVRHGLNPDEYPQRWGLKSNHPLTAPAYSEQALGLGRRRAILATPVVKADEAPGPAATSKPIRKARGTTKPAEAATPSVQIPRY